MIFFPVLEREIELELGNHRILLTHGHYYNVSLGVEGLREEAIERGCDIAMYGHTHRPYLEQGGKVTILNPGSLSYPRQEGHRPSYMIMELDKDGTPSYHTCYLDMKNEKDNRKGCRARFIFRNSEEAVEGELRKSSSSDFWKKPKTEDWNLEK